MDAPHTLGRRPAPTPREHPASASPLPGAAAERDAPPPPQSPDPPGREDVFDPPFNYWEDLLAFYLIGCAFHGGAPSLRRAVTSVLARHDGRLVAAINLSRASASRLILRLEDKVFCPRYGGRRYLLLLSYEPGKAARLSDVGERAWQETRDFFGRRGLLPTW